jgi:hypothetical protein
VNERPLTEAQRAYLRAFEDWLFDSESDLAWRRRRNALELLLFEADIVPKNRPEVAATPSKLARLADKLEELNAKEHPAAVKT